MICYGLIVRDFDMSVVLKIVPMVYFLYLTALFINVACKPRKLVARKALYISYLFLTIGAESFYLKEVITYFYSYIMYYIVK